METVYEMRILLIIGVPLWIIVRGTILFLKKRNGFKVNLYKEILTNVFVLYLFMLIGITIFPIRIGDAINYLPDMSIYEKYNINLIPFIDYLKNKVSFKVLIKNIGDVYSENIEYINNLNTINYNTIAFAISVLALIIAIVAIFI